MSPNPSFDLYKELEVPRSAMTEEVVSAYRRLALIHHPDKNPESEKDATEKFQRIQTAHETLSDPIKRGQYDSQLLGRPRAQGPGGSSSSSRRYGPWTPATSNRRRSAYTYASDGGGGGVDSDSDRGELHPCKQDPFLGLDADASYEDYLARAAELTRSRAPTGGGGGGGDDDVAAAWVRDDEAMFQRCRITAGHWRLAQAGRHRTADQAAAAAARDPDGGRRGHRWRAAGACGHPH